MSWSITIGELHTYKEDGQTFTEALPAEHPDAPAYNEPTDGTNSRWPSYTGWARFCEFAGLNFAPFNGMHDGYGYYMINAATVKIFDLCYETFYQFHPNAKPGFSPKLQNPKIISDPDWPEENNHAARLEWLKYWLHWAMKNCKNPIIHYS